MWWLYVVVVCGGCVWWLCVVVVCGGCVWWLYVVVVCGGCVVLCDYVPCNTCFWLLYSTAACAPVGPAPLQPALVVFLPSTSAHTALAPMGVLLYIYTHRIGIFTL